MKEIEEALRLELQSLEEQAQPMRRAVQRADLELKPLEAKIQRIRQALDLIVESR